MSAVISDLGASIGFGALALSFLLAGFSILALLIALIMRVSSRRFTPLIFGPALRFAFLSITTDLLGSVVCYAFERHVIFGLAWHAGQSGIALLVGTIAFLLLRREPKPPSDLLPFPRQRQSALDLCSED